MKPEQLWINVDGEEVQYNISIDPEDMDNIVAAELRRCYVALAHPFGDWPERIPTMEAILVVLDHYMPKSEYEAWYETIKEL